MKQVFTGLSTLEAHVISHMLEANGIKTNISGEYLSSARGDLSALDQGGVWVIDDSDADQARELIAKWEKENPTPKTDKIEKQINEKKGGAVAIGTLVGFAIGILVTYLHFYSPVTIEGVDINKDGKNDIHYYYANGLLYEMESDLNLDGIIDRKDQYNQRGIMEIVLMDSDFDSKFETTIFYTDGNPEKEERDYNNDGKPDVVFYYDVTGDLKSSEIYDLETGRLVRTNEYARGKRASSILDSDRDGSLETKYTYDEYEEVKTKKPLSKIEE